MREPTTDLARSRGRLFIKKLYHQRVLLLAEGKYAHSYPGDELTCRPGIPYRLAKLDWDYPRQAEVIPYC